MSCGWNCKDFIEQTLASIEMQSADNWSVRIVYDGGDGGEELIRKWCDSRDDRWQYVINKEPHPHENPVTNRVDAAYVSTDDPEDVLIWLDLDGDCFTHPDVLKHLMDYYADGTLLTYGSYLPDPPDEGCSMAQPFPDEVAADNSFRSFVLYGGGASFNHLRTMKSKVAQAIPLDQFKWTDGRGWYTAGIDYLFTIAALELIGPKYRCITETLMLYNTANPNAAWRLFASDLDDCIIDFLKKPPLQRLF